MLSKRNIAIAVALVLVLGTVGALAPDEQGPEAPVQSAPAESETTPEPRGDRPERNDGPIGTPDAEALAGAPVPTARRFVGEWVNRTASAAELRRQRPILIGLATGEFAQLVQVTIDDARATGKFGPENEGEVLIAKAVEGEGGGVTVLVVTRERQVENGAALERYRYVTYLARLAAIPGGGYAISALEPQA